MRSYFYVALVLMIIFGAIGGYLTKRYLEFSKLDFSPPPVTVAVERAVVDSWSQSLNAVGTINAVRGIELKSETAGEVSEIYFESGQTVSAGQPLVRLNDDVEQATRKNRLANLELARVFFDRDKALLENKSISQSKFDQSRANKDSAVAKLSEIEAVLSRKVISAPFAGVIGLRRIDLGDYLSLGDVITNLQDLTQLEIDFSIPSRYRASLKTGLTLDVKVDAFPDSTYTAKVSAIDSRVDVSTRTLSIRAIFDKTQGLMPGMFGSLNLDLGQTQELVTLPETAVTYSVQGNVVYFVHEDKKVSTAFPRVVEVGPARDGKVAILSGVSEDELIVTAGQNKLYRGAKVRFDNSSGFK